MGQGNIAIHDRKRQRYRCKICKHTFSARQGTMFARAAQATRADHDRGDASFVWLSDPGD